MIHSLFSSNSYNVLKFDWTCFTSSPCSTDSLDSRPPTHRPRANHSCADIENTSTLARVLMCLLNCKCFSQMPLPFAKLPERLTSQQDIYMVKPHGHTCCQSGWIELPQYMQGKQIRNQVNSMRLNGEL